MTRHISLLLPDLLRPGSLPPAAAGQPEPEALEWLLTLAERRPRPQVGMETLLWQEAGMTGPVPVATLSYLYDCGEMPPGPVLRADPVCLAADRDCVRLVSGGAADSGADIGPDLEMDEARQLIAEINAQFSDEPWTLVAGTARRWYLLLDEAAGINCQPPPLVLGHNILDFMPAGPRQGYWRNIFNEIQMLMFASPVNEQRQMAGRSAANSLWLWGAGDASLAVSPPWAAVYGSDPVAAALGLLAGVPVAPAPESAGQLLDMAPPAGRILCQPGITGGREGLITFNHDWALPLYKALQRGFSRPRTRHELSSIELLTTNGFSYVLSAGKRRWWRRRRRIDSFLE